VRLTLNIDIWTDDANAPVCSIDRLSANGWEGQSIVVTLSRTCAPTRPIAGPTRGPACVFPSGYMSGYSTPPRVTQNLAAPGSPE